MNLFALFCIVDHVSYGITEVNCGILCLLKGVGTASYLKEQRAGGVLLMKA